MRVKLNEQRPVGGVAPGTAISIPINNAMEYCIVVNLGISGEKDVPDRQRVVRIRDGMQCDVDRSLNCIVHSNVYLMVE